MFVWVNSPTFAPYQSICNHTLHVKTMKKAAICLAVICLVFFAATVQAQTSAVNFYAGAWELQVDGAPGSASTMTLNLEYKNKQWSGTVERPGKAIVQVQKVTESASGITVYYDSDGHAVDFFLKKKDEQQVTGELMNMYAVTGKRVVAKKK